MTGTTAKAQLNEKAEAWGGNVSLNFGADYADGRNQDWAAATPVFSCQMTVRADIAENYQLGGKYTFIILPTVDETPAPAETDVQAPTAEETAAVAAAEPDVNAAPPAAAEPETDQAADAPSA